MRAVKHFHSPSIWHFDDEAKARANLRLWTLFKTIPRVLFLSLARQRHREAASIVSFYGNDRWSDCVEREVNDIYFDRTPPSRN